MGSRILSPQTIGPHTVKIQVSDRTYAEKQTHTHTRTLTSVSLLMQWPLNSKTVTSKVTFMWTFLFVKLIPPVGKLCPASLNSLLLVSASVFRPKVCHASAKIREAFNCQARPFKKICYSRHESKSHLWLIWVYSQLIAWKKKPHIAVSKWPYVTRALSPMVIRKLVAMVTGLMLRRETQWCPYLSRIQTEPLISVDR